MRAPSQSDESTKMHPATKPSEVTVINSPYFLSLLQSLVNGVAVPVVKLNFCWRVVGLFLFAAARQGAPQCG
eukprot:1512006-Amphidinium_carterae.1